MNYDRRWNARVMCGGFIVALIFCVSVRAQQPSMEGKTAEQVYKNIKVLNGTPADQLNLAMHLVEGQLGVDCTFCHVDHEPTHFEKDDNPKKETARKMMKMVFELNKNSFDGKQAITCYTCHQGKPDPVGTLVVPLSTKIEEEEPLQPALPSVDQILAKYVQALGGEQALRKVTTRVIVGTQNLSSGPGGKIPLPAAIERYQKAPNVVATIQNVPNGMLADGFDGTNVWAQNQKGVRCERAAGRRPEAREAQRGPVSEPRSEKGIHQDDGGRRRPGERSRGLRRRGYSGK